MSLEHPLTEKNKWGNFPVLCFNVWLKGMCVGQSGKCINTRLSEHRRSLHGNPHIKLFSTLNRRGLNAMKDKSHLNIGWDRCLVSDHHFLPRCTKCAEHGHNAIDCEGPLRCTDCGRGGHWQEECRNDPYCCACEREGRTEDLRHTTMAWNCPVYLERLQTENRRITAHSN